MKVCGPKLGEQVDSSGRNAGVYDWDPTMSFLLLPVLGTSPAVEQAAFGPASLAGCFSLHSCGQPGEGAAYFQLAQSRGKLWRMASRLCLSFWISSRSCSKASIRCRCCSDSCCRALSFCPRAPDPARRACKRSSWDRLALSAASVWGVRSRSPGREKGVVLFMTGPPQRTAVEGLHPPPHTQKITSFRAPLFPNKVSFKKKLSHGI